VCDLETSRMGAPYIYDISRLNVKVLFVHERSYEILKGGVVLTAPYH
jgi:hypothetical protein